MEIGLNYNNLELCENISDILSTDFWVLKDFTASMIPLVRDPIKFTSNASIFVKKGKCKFEIDLIPYEIEAPFFVNIRDSQILQFYNFSEDFDSSFIVISKRFRENLFLMIKDSPVHTVASQHQVIKIPQDMMERFERFYSHITEIFKDSKDRNAYQAMVFAIASFFFECGYKCYLPLMEKISKGQSRIQEKFISLVQQNFKKERFLDYYATKLNVTPKHLSRCVKSSSGFTAVEWIDRYVILEAKVLLRSTNLSIQQISDELNFASQSFFGKYFKKHTGFTPKDFRNNFIEHSRD